MGLKRRKNGKMDLRCLTKEEREIIRVFLQERQEWLRRGLDAAREGLRIVPVPSSAPGMFRYYYHATRTCEWLLTCIERGQGGDAQGLSGTDRTDGGG